MIEKTDYIPIQEHYPFSFDNINDIPIGKKLLSNINEEEFQKISKTAEIIEQKLAKFPLKHRLNIIGGCIRDLLLNKPIKDVDILISIDYEYASKMLDNIEKTEKEYEIKQHKKSDSMSLFVIQELQHELTGLEFESYSSYIDAEDNTTIKTLGTEDTKNNMLGVIKITNDSLPFDVDLIISILNVSDYVRHFDFNICQTILPIKKQETISKQKIIVSNYFIHDVTSNSLTMNMNSFNQHKKILNSLEKHYPRLQTKYPEHKFSILHREERYNPFKKEDIQRIFDFTTINTYNSTKTKINKQKI